VDFEDLVRYVRLALIGTTEHSVGEHTRRRSTRFREAAVFNRKHLFAPATLQLSIAGGGRALLTEDADLLATVGAVARVHCDELAVGADQLFELFVVSDVQVAQDRLQVFERLVDGSRLESGGHCGDWLRINDLINYVKGHSVRFYHYELLFSFACFFLLN